MRENRQPKILLEKTKRRARFGNLSQSPKLTVGGLNQRQTDSSSPPPSLLQAKPPERKRKPARHALLKALNRRAAVVSAGPSNIWNHVSARLEPEGMDFALAALFETGRDSQWFSFYPSPVFLRVKGELHCLPVITGGIHLLN